MTIQIAHIGDMHFGGLANVPVVEALERLLPDLRPDAIVIGGDLSQRARHGEFQRGRAVAVSRHEDANARPRGNTPWGARCERSPPITIASGRRSGSSRSSASTTGMLASPPKCMSPM